MNWSSVRLALRELMANKFRTFLTCLGVIIGVGSVIALMTIGAGVSAQITRDLASFGSNLVVAFPGGPDAGGRGDDIPFDRADVQAARSSVPGLQDITPIAQRSVQATFGSWRADTQVSGADPSFFRIGQWGFAEGRGFTETENGRTACVLGQTVRDKLFGGGDALGQRIRLGAVSCEVIGVLAAKGTSLVGGDQDDLIVMPLGAFQRRLQGASDIYIIQISAATQADIPRVMDGLRQSLRESRGVGVDQLDTFTVRDLQGFVEEAQNIFGYVTLFVAAVAAISLIVGGIGIMNIMLVSVSERTREIGVRLAIGAQERDVLAQFLVEAMVLSLLGGVVGITIGYGLAALGVGLIGLPFLPDPMVGLVAAGFSAAFGIVFGFFPARRAAKLNPIEALRFE